MQLTGCGAPTVPADQTSRSQRLRSSRHMNATMTALVHDFILLVDWTAEVHVSYYWRIRS